MTTRTADPGGSPHPGTYGSAEDLRLCLRAAMLYHLDGLTQAAVADRLGVSRATAGRLVARAREHGLVTIEVALPPHLGGTLHAGLEERLEQRFGLTEAVVTQSADGSAEAGLAALGRAAAAVLVRRVHPDDRVGLAWGRTMAAMTDALHAHSARCAEVVQLDGSAGGAGPWTNGEYIVGHTAAALGAEPYTLNAPLYADPQTVTSLAQDSVVSRTIGRFQTCDLTMFSVGDLSTSTTLFSDSFIDEAAMDDLVRRGAVGDACGRFYRHDGSAVDGPLVDRTVSVELSDLRRCPTTVVVAGGARKLESVLGALHGGLANVLVTDDDLAGRLLAATERPVPVPGEPAGTRPAQEGVS